MTEVRPPLLRRLANDPVARFLVLGALIFGAHRMLSRGGSEPIVVSSRFVDGLVAEHQQRFGRAPSPSERERLVAQWIREETLVRRANEAGLDRGDPIVRRRLAQKMELLLRGSLEIARPDDDAIRAWMAEHRELVARDERYTLRHAFASRDMRPTSALADATAWMEPLRDSADPVALVRTYGDAFALGPELVGMTGADLEDRFGAPFRAALRECELRRPCGPIESPYGFHVVVLTAREPAGTMPFAAARPIAERAILRQREDAALERAIDELVAEQGVERVDDRRGRR